MDEATKATALLFLIIAAVYAVLFLWAEVYLPRRHRREAEAEPDTRTPAQREAAQLLESVRRSADAAIAANSRRAKSVEGRKP